MLEHIGKWSDRELQVYRRHVLTERDVKWDELDQLDVEIQRRLDARKDEKR